MCLFSDNNFAKLLRNSVKRNCLKRQTGWIRAWKQNNGWASSILAETKHIHQDKILLLFKGTCHLKKKKNQPNPTKILSLLNQGWTWCCSCLSLERKICEIIFISLLKRLEVVFRIVWYYWDNLHNSSWCGKSLSWMLWSHLSTICGFLLFRKLRC